MTKREKEEEKKENARRFDPFLGESGPRRFALNETEGELLASCTAGWMKRSPFFDPCESHRLRPAGKPDSCATAVPLYRHHIDIRY